MISLSFLRAEDWTTIDGKVYQNVTVLGTAPDAVTILHKDGGGIIPLVMLPPELQQRFHYDPEKAREAADARLQQEIADARALRAERAQDTEQRQADADSEAENEAAAVKATPAVATTSASSSAAHNSIDSLASSITSLRRDLNDPTYHTMAHAVMAVHSLQADPNDPNHHSISDIANSGL